MRRAGQARLSAFQAGLIALAVIAIAVYAIFHPQLPFRHEFTVHAVFRSANGIQPRSPVRIAGVGVGRVTEVKHAERGSAAGVVTMAIDNQALPLHSDATAKVRPRLFLEGNFFVDLSPGSPSTPRLRDGGTIPVQQTASPVQLDQVLDALDRNTRDDVRVLLAEYSRGLSNGGAAGYNGSIPYWEPAYRGISLVNQATLGTESHDLSRFIASGGAVARALDRQRESLKSVVRDFSTFAGSLASERDNLTRAVAELPRTLRAGIPTFQAVDRALPPVRRLAREALPGVRSTGPMVDASLPFVRQLSGLFSNPELRGLVGDLRPSVPALARLSAELVPLYGQVRAASSCQNEVILPWTRDRVPDQRFPPSGPVYEEGVKWLPGVAAESRSGDANGQWFRTLTGAGTKTLPLGGGRFATTLFPILGVNPPKPSGLEPLRPDVPCETQQQPDLRTNPGPAPPQVELGLDTPAARARFERAGQTAVRWLRGEIRRQGLSSALRVSRDWFTAAQLHSQALGRLGNAGRPGR